MKLYFQGLPRATYHMRGTYDGPFIFFPNIHMPKISGIELRKQVFGNESIRLKTIPYLFFSACPEQRDVIDAYLRSIQGFLAKPSECGELKNLILINTG